MYVGNNAKINNIQNPQYTMNSNNAYLHNIDNVGACNNKTCNDARYFANNIHSNLSNNTKYFNSDVYDDKKYNTKTYNKTYNTKYPIITNTNRTNYERT